MNEKVQWNAYLGTRFAAEVFILFCIIGVNLHVASLTVDAKQKREGSTPSFNVKGGETRPILDPRQFRGKTQEAYAAAKEIPQIMDKLFCYCFCHNVPFEHKSLLSCFVTKHGAG